MRCTFLLIVASLGALSLAGCGGGSDSNAMAAPNPGTMVPPVSATGGDFTAFVKAQIADTSDTTQPVPVNGLDFNFNDQNNPAAFDDITQPGPGH